MKLLFAIVVLCISLGNATPSESRYVPAEKNEKTDHKRGEDDDVSKNKNAHSLKKWKMTIEYNNGSIVSKTIVVDKDSKRSALETAFEEAEKHLRNIKSVKNYSISPVTKSYVVLAGE
ncbi:hypothetical protein [Aquimarina celericrescens]|uniref:TonB C-terminal domain-containing protein n=1 Tax=Aquimarina celericrescens TaxID=1964542 RepID=A0ABW5AS18_9FLAO|nr:hypothetical protein [Aquimarina celericrescens]